MVTYKGKTYETRKRLCLEMGIPPSTVSERLRHNPGMSLEEAIDRSFDGVKRNGRYPKIYEELKCRAKRNE